MKRILITGILAFSTFMAFSQRPSTEYDLYSRTIDIDQKSMAFGLTEAEFEAIKNEAYANPSFVSGNIYQGDKIIKAGVPMRYNALEDEIEIKKTPTDENYGALVKDPEIFVKMGQDIYLFVPYEGSNEKGGYFNVLSDGETYDLYKKTTSVFREGKKAQSTYERDIPPSFKKNATYYLVEGGTFLEMPKGKSRILRMMDKNKSEIRTYIKENKLNIDKEEDLINVISYFDSLQ